PGRAMSAVGARLQGWFAELRRLKVMRVAGVYLVAAWLAIQVADAVFEPLGLPAWSLRLLIVAAAVGFPLACALAWAFDVTPQRLERILPAGEPSAAPALPVAGAAASVPATAVPPPAASVAILPFTDMSPGRDQEY